jgi:polysaccharide biosynthesis/export protein
LRLQYPLILLVLSFAFSSCKYYKQDIMFQTEKSRNWVAEAKNNIEHTYRIKKHDLIEVQIFTNKGEILLDPNSELARQLTLVGAGGIGGTQQGVGGSLGGGASVGSTNTENTTQIGRYQVDEKGRVNLPLIGFIKIDSMTYEEVDSFLAKQFASYYEDPFVICRVANRRVYYISGQGAGGSTGGGGGGGGGIAGSSRMIALQHDNTHIFEILAAVGGVQAFSKVGKIRIIRGNLKDPMVQVLSLSTIESIMSADLIVQPNDIIYVEPGRRPFVEAFKDYAPVITSVFGVFSITLSTIIAVRAFR